MKVSKISTKPDWYQPYAISLGVQAGDLVFVSGQAAVDEHGNTVGVDDFDRQAHQVFQNLEKVLQAANTSLAHVVKVTIFVRDMAVIDRVIELRRQYFTEPYPADTIAQVQSLARPEWLLEIEATAVVPPRHG